MAKAAKQSLGKRVTAYMERKGILAKEFARRADVPDSWLANLRNGKPCGRGIRQRVERFLSGEKLKPRVKRGTGRTKLKATLKENNPTEDLLPVFKMILRAAAPSCTVADLEFLLTLRRDYERGGMKLTQAMVEDVFAQRKK